MNSYVGIQLLFAFSVVGTVVGEAYHYSANLIEAVCPLENLNLLCNIHLDQSYQCFCHSKRPNSTKPEDFHQFVRPTCDKLVPNVDVKVNVLETLVNMADLKVFTWGEFDKNFSIEMSNRAKKLPSQVMILRKFCTYPQTLTVQFAFLEELQSTKVLENEQIVQNDYFLPNTARYFKNNPYDESATFHEVRSASHLAPQDPLTFLYSTVCDKGNLTKPVLCNAHNPKFTCACNIDITNDSDYPLCDHIFENITDIYSDANKLFTLIIAKAFDEIPQNFDEMIIKSISNATAVSMHLIVLIRKYCEKNHLYVQFVRVESASVPLKMKAFASNSRYETSLLTKNEYFPKGMLSMLMTPDRYIPLMSIYGALEKFEPYDYDPTDLDFDTFEKCLLLWATFVFFFFPMLGHFISNVFNREQLKVDLVMEHIKARRAERAAAAAAAAVAAAANENDCETTSTALPLSLEGGSDIF